MMLPDSKCNTENSTVLKLIKDLAPDLSVTTISNLILHFIGSLFPGSVLNLIPHLTFNVDHLDTL